MGTLTVTRANTYAALKCLVAASFSGQKLNVEVDTASKEAVSLRKDECFLKDPLSIGFLLSRKSVPYGLEDEGKMAQGLQWLYFGQSEIGPHLEGYLYGLSSSSWTRDVAYQQKQRAAKLSGALIKLDDFLRSRTFLVGERLTLADTHLAVDVLPLFDVRLADGRQLVKAVCPGNNLVHLRRWHETIINQKGFRAAYDPKFFNVQIAPEEKKKATTKNENKKQQPRKEEEKLRLLCLHGYRQTEATFYEKLGAFRKMVGKKCVMKLVNAPHLVPNETATDGKEEEQRGWWFSQPHGYFKSDDVSDCDKGFEESWQLIRRTIDEEGPFDGIMGFSQGAALAVLICMCPEMVANFKFAMFFAPFKSACSKHAHFYNEESSVKIPALFVIGHGDKVIDPRRSEALVPLFGRAEVIKHDGGHFVPATSQQKQAYLAFLEAAQQ